MHSCAFFIRAILAIALVSIPWLACAAAPEASGLPFKREAVADGMLGLQAWALIILLLLVLVLVQVYLRRRIKGDGASGLWDWRRALHMPAADPALRIAATTRIDARASLHVIEWEGSRLLIARSENSITLLAERRDSAGIVPPPDERNARRPSL